MSLSNVKGASVKFNSSLSSADAKLSNERGTIHFTTDGEIILNGEKYSGVTKVEESANNGYIKVDGSEVAIHGLGTAAYENSEVFATAAQGILAENAIPSSEKAQANGVATLDANGHVPAAQLPSYVDDVLEYASISSFPEEGEEGKIYVALDNNKTYRWGGTTYVVISETLAIGTTEGTAFSGKSGYDHVTNTEIHITDDERNTWNGKQDAITVDNKLSSDLVSVVVSGDTDYDGTYTATEIINSLADGITDINDSLTEADYENRVSTLEENLDGHTVKTDVPENAVFTDLHVTSVDYHYAPAENAASQIDAAGATATDIMGSAGVQVVTGIKRDAKGHVVGVVSGSVKSILPTAAANTLGGVKIGEGVAINDGVISVDDATVHINNASGLSISNAETGMTLATLVEGIDTDLSDHETRITAIETALTWD